MPTTLVDALKHEFESFNRLLQKINEELEVSSKHFTNKKEISARLDDLENIILAVSSSMSEHVSSKARNAFNELRSSIEEDEPERGPELLQLINRLQSHSEMIIKRVGNIFNAYNSTENTANGIILAQEEERRRISREIHDGPAQTLASLTMKIDYCLEAPEVHEKIRLELVDLKESVIRSLKDIRRFIFDLRPMALDDLGLVPTLEQFISGFKKRTGVPVYVSIEGERASMNSEIELAVFRIIQEACNNAVKHADPSSVHIFVKFDERKNRLTIVIKDDGSGFDLAEIRKNYSTLKKLGLKSMEERARLSGGDLEILSDKGEGTVVSFWVPLVI
jgi:two-component system sensor histidine kinase DegS